MKSITDLQKIEGFIEITTFIDKYPQLIDRGRLAEYFCEHLFDVTLNKVMNEKGFDATTRSGKKIEIKAREVKNTPPGMKINLGEIDLVWYVALDKRLIPQVIYEYKAKQLTQMKNGRVSFSNAEPKILFLDIQIKKHFFTKGKVGDLEFDNKYHKPWVLHNGDNVCPEIAVLSIYNKDYDGVWVDSYGKKYWTNRKTTVDSSYLPKNIRGEIDFIKKRGGYWDLVLWKDGEFKFIELKGRPSNDEIHENQVKFLNNLTNKGYSRNNFTLWEWDWEK